jgi:hypothetical protein
VLRPVEKREARGEMLVGTRNRKRSAKYGSRQGQSRKVGSELERDGHWRRATRFEGMPIELLSCGLEDKGGYGEDIKGLSPRREGAWFPRKSTLSLTLSLSLSLRIVAWCSGGYELGFCDEKGRRGSWNGATWSGQMGSL